MSKRKASFLSSAARGIPALPAEPAADKPDELVPDPVVWREFHISPMTGWRWTNDHALDFPPPVRIRNRCFRSRRLLEEFKARMLRMAFDARSGKAT